MKHFLTILFLLFCTISCHEVMVEDFQLHVPELSFCSGTTIAAPSFPSCDQYKHRNTSHVIAEPLHLYTSKQLQAYFAHQGYSEQDILHHEALYLSDEFVKLAKTYSHYEDTIRALHDKFSNFNLVKKVLLCYSKEATDQVLRRK